MVFNVKCKFIGADDPKTLDDHGFVDLNPAPLNEIRIAVF